MPNSISEHTVFMKKAIHLAKRAAALGEVPIGCVIVHEGKVIGRGFNRRLSSHSALAHAEIIAIRQACRKMGDWRLEGCTLYVTLEPCQMCSGAIVQARLDCVIVGAPNPKAGCAGSIINLLQMKEFNHQVEIVNGVCADECSAMLSDFFRDMRAREREAAAKNAETGAPAGQE